MSTQAQIDANRRNAQLSTGPVTPQGKAVVSQNAFKNGLRSELYMRDWKDRADFLVLSADLISEHQPQTPTEEIYVERMAISYHKLGVCELTEEEWAAADEGDSRLSSLRQQQARLEHAFDKALSQLKKLQADRKKQQALVETEAGKEAGKAEIKQDARKIVSEALNQISKMRQVEERVAKLTAAPPPEVIFAGPDAPPSS